MTDKYDPKKFTPAFLKGVFKKQFELIAKHEEIKATLYEMMASMIYHAPLVRPAEVRMFHSRGYAIIQPTHWLVYPSSERNRVRVYASDAWELASVPPDPIGFMISTGKYIAHDEIVEPKFLALHGKRLLGEWGAARCISEITARQ